MKKLLKKLSKKTISCILALCIILCSVTVSLSAFADDGDVYTVSYKSPVIPMFEGKILNYEDIAVKFSDSLTVNGADITWALNETVRDDDNVSVRSKYIYAPITGRTCLTAKYGELTQNVWVIVNSRDDYNFNLVDLDLSKDYVKSDWIYGITASDGTQGFDPNNLSGSVVYNATQLNSLNVSQNWNTKVKMVLYRSDILSDFADYTIDATISFASSEDGTKALMGIVTRAEINPDIFAEDGTVSSNATTLSIIKPNTVATIARMRMFGGMGLYGYTPVESTNVSVRNIEFATTLHTLSNPSVLKYNNADPSYILNTSTIKYADNSTNANKDRSLVLTLDGNDIKYVLDNKTIFDSKADALKTLYFTTGYDTASGTGSLGMLSKEDPDSIFEDGVITKDSYNAVMNSYGQGKGTIGFTWSRSFGLNVKKLKVMLNEAITAKNMPNLKDPTFYTISATSPAIPMFSGKVVEFADLMVYFNDAVSANGADIDWEINTEADNDNNVILMGTRIYAVSVGKTCLKATYKGNTKNVWVIVNEEGNLDFELVNIDMSKLTQADITSSADWMYAKATDDTNHVIAKQNWLASGWNANYPTANKPYLHFYNYTTSHYVFYNAPILKDFADYIFTAQAAGGTSDDVHTNLGFVLRANIDFSESASTDILTGGALALTHRQYGGVQVTSYNSTRGLAGTLSRGHDRVGLHTLGSDYTKLVNTGEVSNNSSSAPAGDPAYILAMQSSNKRTITAELKGNNIRYTLGDKVILDTFDKSKKVYALSDSHLSSTHVNAEFDYDTAFANYGYNGPGNAIGFTFVQGELFVYSMSVKLVGINSAADLPAMSEASFYTVTEANPVIPMTAGTKLNVGNFFIDVDSSLVAGNEFTWTTSANAAEFAVDGKELKAYKKGTYTLTATDGENVKTVYAVVKNPDEEEYTVFENDYRSGTVKNPDGTYSKRTDYDTWTNVVDINNSVFTSPVTGSLHDSTYDDGWLDTFQTAGFRPYMSSTLRTMIADKGYQESGNYNVKTITLLDNNVIKNLTNYKITADLIMDKGETYSVGLVGRATYDTIDTFSYGYSIVAGGYGSPVKANTIARIMGSSFGTPVSDQTITPTWFTGIQNNANFALHTYTLEFVGDTMTLISPDMHDPEGNKVVTTNLPATKGGIGIVTLNKYSASSKRLAAPSIYSIKVTLTGLSNVDRLGAVQMEDVDIPATEKLGGYTETDTYTLGYTLSNDGNSYSVTSYTNADGLNEKITIPAIHNGKPVTSTATNLISGNTKIGEVVFETAELNGETVGVNIIGERSFHSCRNLEFLTLPETYISNGYGSFQGCITLREIHLPKSFENYNDRIFSGCISLIKATVEGNLVSRYLFENCISLSQVVFKSQKVNLAAYAFTGCTALVNVELPESTSFNLTTASEGVFNGCTNLKEVNLSTVDTVIPTKAFYNCTALAKITIPNNITTIAANAFYGTALTEVTIPDSVLSIEAGAFNGTNVILKKATILNANCEIADGAFLDAVNPDITIYGINGSTAEKYADAHNDLNSEGVDGVRFEAIDYVVDKISLNSKSYLPSKIYGVNAKWYATKNEYFEIYDTGVIVALKKGEANVPCTVAVGGVESDVTVTIKITDYDESAYNHLVASDKVFVAATNTEGEYTVTFGADVLVDYSTFTINNSASINLDEAEATPVPTGKTFVLKATDYGAENLQNIKIKFQNADEAAHSGNIYFLGSTTKDFGDGNYGIRFVNRTPAIKYTETVDGVNYGNFAEKVMVDGKEVTPIAAGALLMPEALVSAEALVLTDALIKKIADGELVENIEIGEFNARNVTIDKLSELTETYADYTVALTDIPENMKDTKICYKNYLIYEENGELFVLYGKLETKDYNSVTEAANIPVAPLNVAQTAVKPGSFTYGKDRVVVCWGDSITQSTVGNSYPSQLMQNLGGQYLVYNGGDAGETPSGILSRANMEDIFLQYDITFAAGEEYSNIFYRGRLPEGGNSASSSQYVDCWVVDSRGKNVYYTTNGNQLPIATGRDEESRGANVVIGGVHYELVEVVDGQLKTNSWGKTNTFKLKRQGDLSTAVTLNAGSKVTYDYSEFYKKADVGVVLFGANGYYFDKYNNDPESKQNLINRYKQIAGSADNMLYILPFFWSMDLKAEFVESFGEDANKLVDLRAYLCDGAFEDYDVIPTEKDLLFMNNLNYTPACFMATQPANNGYDCHMNQLGYKIFADLVYKQGVELGYWK